MKELIREVVTASLFAWHCQAFSTHTCLLLVHTISVIFAINFNSHLIDVASRLIFFLTLRII
jgi:hypothetical protein